MLVKFMSRPIRASRRCALSAAAVLFYSRQLPDPSTPPLAYKLVMGSIKLCRNYAGFISLLTLTQKGKLQPLKMKTSIFRFC